MKIYLLFEFYIILMTGGYIYYKTDQNSPNICVNVWFTSFAGEESETALTAADNTTESSFLAE